MPGNPLASPFANLELRTPLRDYQQELLENAAMHMSDGRLHIVAPPGSGKIPMALECVRRLERPALVLVPSVLDRQQWVNYFASNYLSGLPAEQARIENWISYNAADPKPITILTYQALHALSQIVEETSKTAANGFIGGLTLDDLPGGPSGPKDKLSAIRNAIGSVCLDEAHHLHPQLQNSLQKFLGTLDTLVVTIAVTVSPPYDLEARDMQRYLNTCGPIDLELYSSDLVAGGNMAPFQDLIYFNLPTAYEVRKFTKQRRNSMHSLRYLCQTGVIRELVVPLGVTVYTRGQEADRIEDFLNGDTPGGLDPAAFTYLFTMAAHCGVEIAPEIMKLVLGCHDAPPLNLHTAEKAMQFVLSQPKLFSRATLIEVYDSLQTAGAINDKRVEMATSRKWETSASASPAKLDSIATITQVEARKLGSDLREVILTEHVRSEALENPQSAHSLAAVPIFMHLVPKIPESLGMAVLSASITILPRRIWPAISDLASQMRIPVNAEPLSGYEETYLSVNFGAYTQAGLQLMTHAFESGIINILIGTTTLLGDNWETGYINSMILAVPNASFVESNQLRGRAARPDPRDRAASPNIWHLITLSPGPEEHESFPDQLPLSLLNVMYSDPDNVKDEVLLTEDWKSAERRFNAFIGPHLNGEMVCSNIDRLDLGTAHFPPVSPKEISEYNLLALKAGVNRDAAVETWRTATEGFHEHHPIRREYYVDRKSLPLRFIRKEKWLGISAGIILAALSLILPFSLSGGDSINFVYLYLGLLGLGLLWCAFNVKKLRRINAVWFHLSNPRRYVLSLAKAIAFSLVGIGQVREKAAKSLVVSYLDKDTIRFYLKEATTDEQLVFGIAMNQLMSPIDKPQYILARTSHRGNGIRFAISCPEIFGSRPDRIHVLLQQLDKVGWGGLKGIKTSSNLERLYQSRQVCFGSGTNLKMFRRRVCSTQE